MKKATNMIKNNENHKKQNNFKPKNQKFPLSDFQFYISRYPFPHTSLIHQNEYYKTFYECEGFQLTEDKISRLTSFNKLSHLIRLKVIVKNVNKPGSSLSKDEHRIITHSYSLYYEIVHHFVLSALAIKIIKSISHGKDYRKLFLGVSQVIQTLISQKVFYLLDIQNIGLTVGGNIKVYVPANYILEQNIFTEHHEHEMRTTANAVIQCLVRAIQGFTHQTEAMDIEQVKHQVRKQMQKLQIKSKNIQSQIFTFNQNIQSIKDQEQHHLLKNQDLQKTIKIRKCSEMIEVIPPMEINSPKNRKNSKMVQRHKRCVTSRDQVDHFYNDLDDHKITKGEVIYENQPKQNEILKERMKQYEEKLNSLGNTVKLMKQQLLGMNKKVKQKRNKSPQKLAKSKKNQENPRPRSHTLTFIDESAQQISIMVQRLSASKIQIKKLLNNQSNLKNSYHVQEQEEIQKQKKNFQDRKQSQQTQKLGFNFEQQFKAIVESQNQEPFQIKRQNTSVQKIKKQDFEQANAISDMKETIKLTDKNSASKSKSKGKQIQKVEPLRKESFIQNKQIQRQFYNSLPNNAKLMDHSSRKKNQKSPKSYDYESSLGNQSPPGGNPFREYGNFRIQYVIDEENNQEDKNTQHVGYIKIHPQSIKQPYKIVKAPIKKQHVLYPLVRIREPFRYSCLAIAPNTQFQYIAIPQNIYDPTEYDSIDTFEMELGKQYTMPKIVSKSAFRHTLFPSTIVGRLRSPPQKTEKQSNDSLTGSTSNKKQKVKNRIHESAQKSKFVEIVQPIIIRQRQSKPKDNISQKKSSKKLPRIPQLIIKQAPETNQQGQQEQSPYKINVKSPQQKRLKQLKEPKVQRWGKQSSCKSLQKQKNPVSNQKMRDKSQKTISQTQKDVSKILKNHFKQQQNPTLQNSKKSPLNLAQHFNPTNPKKIDKQKLNQILNKSKQIISKYKNLTTKKP